MWHRIHNYRRTITFLYITAVLAALLILAWRFLVSPAQGFLAIHAVRLALTGGWWAMLGGVAIGYKGIADHRSRSSWEDGWSLWYLMRPFSSLVVGLVTFAILQVANAQAEPSVPALAVVAFTFGTQERRFFTFLYQVANLILSTPGDQADSLQVTSISPETGAPGAVLMVEGSGFRKGATVTVGGQELTKPVTSPDGSSIAGIIPHGKGTVDVMVTNPDDAARRSPKRFTYA